MEITSETMYQIYIVGCLAFIWFQHTVIKTKNRQFFEMTDLAQRANDNGIKASKLAKENHKLLAKNTDRLALAMERELYLIKTMNDAMNVKDTKGFMAQRMSNAPSHFRPVRESDVKPDKVD